MAKKLNSDTTIILPRKLLLPYFEGKFEIDRTKAKHGSVYRYRKNPGVNTFIYTLKKCKKNVLVLDLGCGDGRFALKYAQNGFKTIGIDFSPNAIKQMKKKAKKLKISHLLKGKVADITKINYSFNKFDGISSCNMLHYFSDEELKEIIKKMKDATKKHGLNYISFQSEISAELPDGRKFRFEGQIYRKSEEMIKFLKDQYEDWGIMKFWVGKNTVKGGLPKCVHEILKTNSNYYKRSFRTIDVVARKLR